MSFYGATDIPVLDFWRHLLWVSKPEWEVLFKLGRDIHDVHSLQFPCCTTPANLLTTSRVTGCCSSHVCFSRVRMPYLNDTTPNLQNTMNMTLFK